MNPRSFILSRALGGATLLIATAVFAADTPPAPPRSPPKNEAAAGVLDAEKQVEVMVRYAMPGKPHQLLNQMAGAWDTVTRYWMKPGTEAVEAKGTSARKWILDGRFLLEELDGGNLAIPFRGLAVYGYDAFDAKYTSAWMDTTSTAILTNLGTYDKTNHLVNFDGEYKDPWTGSRKKSRGLTRFLSSDKHALELYVTESDGKEFKMLEITYTRKAAGDK
jgi:hypothetical protein